MLLFSLRAFPSSVSGGGHISSHSRSFGCCSLHQSQMPWLYKQKPLGNHWQNTNTRGLLLVVLQDFEYFLGCQSHRHLSCNVVKKKKKDSGNRGRIHIIYSLVPWPSILPSCRLPCVGMGCCKPNPRPSRRVFCCLAVRGLTRSRI